MKRSIVNIIVLFSLIIFSLPAFSYSGLIYENHPSGTISMHQSLAVGDDMGWEVNIGQNKQVRVSFSTEFTYGSESLTIYETDNTGTFLRNVAVSTSYMSGGGCTLNANGKFRIYYKNINAQVAHGFDLQYTADNSLTTSQDLYVGGKVGIGTSTPACKLEVNGDVSVGLNNSTMPITGYGAKLKLFGLNDGVSWDPTWIARYNSAPDNTEIRVNLGDNNHGDDKFVVGTTYWDGDVWQPAMAVKNNGFVGIGTDDPKAKLHVVSKPILGTTVGAVETLTKIDAQVTSGNTLSITDYTVRDANGSASNWESASYIRGLDVDNYFVSQSGVLNGLFCWTKLKPKAGKVEFGSASKTYLSMDATGSMLSSKVGINISSQRANQTPRAELEVNGTILASEVKVESVSNFADFVFDKDYKLRDLKEVNSYIEENGHLPEIPSAKEVKENGMNLVDMQVKLLQKVEEMTLYIIAQEKKMKAMQQRLDRLDGRK
ncbi:MAG: hypothetical protein WCJ80_11955 [Bacteroidota bacterium]